MPAQSGGSFNWPMLLAAVSSFANTNAQTRVRQDQIDDLWAGQHAMQQRQQRMDQSIGDEIATTAAETSDAASTESLADYTAALQQARSRGQASSVPASALGDEYQAGAKQARTDVVRRSSDRARQLATVQGAARTRERAGQRRSRLQQDLETQGRHAGMDAFLAELAARNRFVNPYTELVSGLGSRIAQNYAFEPGAARKRRQQGNLTVYPGDYVDPGTGSTRGFA